MAEGGERRKHQRIRFETRIDLVYKGVNGFASVRTGNVSAGGLFVMLSQPPAAGTVVEFGLMLGARGLHRGSAEVVWTRPAEAADEHPAGFGLRFQSFREGSAELIAELVEEVLSGSAEPTGHGEEEPPAPVETVAARIPTAPIEAGAASEDRDIRPVSDRTTAVLALDLPPAATSEPKPPVEEQEGAGDAPPQPAAEPERDEPAGVATVVTPVAELAAGTTGTPTEKAAAESAAPPQVPAAPEEEKPAGDATVVASAAELAAAAVATQPQAPVPPQPSPDGEPQATTVFDLRQAMAAMQEFRGEAAPGAAGQPAPAPEAPAASAAPPTADEPAHPAKGADRPPGAAPEPAAPAAATAGGATSKPAAKAEPSAPAPEPAKAAVPAKKPEKPTSEPAKPAAKPAEKPKAAAAKPAPAPEKKPEPAAPAKPAAKEKRPRRPVSKGLIRLAVLVLVVGAVYLVSTQTQWGRETTPVAVGWVADAFASLKGKVARSDTESPVASPVESPPAITAANQIVDVTWEGEGPTVLITVTANAPLTEDQILHEELARPPRSLIRVKGINRPFSGFQERTDVPHLVGLRVGHHFELDPPELFVVAEPESGAKVTRVEVSGGTILIEVTIPPTPKPKRGR